MSTLASLKQQFSSAHNPNTFHSRIRPMSFSRRDSWLLSSRHRMPNSTPENCHIDVKEQMQGYLRSVHIKSFTMPWQVYNITAARGNNTFTITDVAGADEVTVTLSDGHYSYTRLASQLQSLFTATIGSFTNLTAITFTYDSGTNFYTVTGTGGTWHIDASVLGNQMGFANSQFDVTTASATGITSTSPAQLLSTSAIYITMEGVTNTKMAVNDGRSHTVARIPVDVGFNELLVWQNSDLRFAQFPRDWYGDFHFKLWDDRGILLVNHNNDWEMDMVCETHVKSV